MRPPRLNRGRLARHRLNMCLFIAAFCAADDRPKLEAAAQAASVGGLRVEVDHSSRWPWAKERPVRATVSEDGGCACSLLSDDAGWEQAAWAMRPDIVNVLASTLEILAAQGPTDLVVEALWVGDRFNKTVSVSPRELAELARHSKLGTLTRYVVDKHAG